MNPLDPHSSTPRTPMPSRPSLPPPMAPQGAKKMEVKKLSQSTMGLGPTAKHSKKTLLITLIVIVCLLIGLAILIAKTGVYRIPYMSSFYHERTVTRVVSSPAIQPRDLVNRATSALQSTTSTRGGDDVRVMFSEQEMTGALKGALQTSLKRPGVTVDQSQIVATPSGLEVAAIVKNETMSAHVFAKVMPRIEGGKLFFDVKEVYLGDLPVPASTLGQIERIVFGSEIGSFKAEAGKYQLKEVQLKDGSVELVFSTSTAQN